MKIEIELDEGFMYDPTRYIIKIICKKYELNKVIEVIKKTDEVF